MISYAFDIGTRSIGAVIFKQDAHGHRLLWSGVTIFGTPIRQKELLKTAIKTRKRRTRRNKRLLKIRNWLEARELLPPYADQSARRKIFNRNPHILFEKGMKQRLSAHEFGRVLYHVAKHRGWSEIKHHACRDFKQQRARLKRLLEAQLKFRKVGDFPPLSFSELTSAFFEKQVPKRCPYVKSEKQLYASQPVAELAISALAMADIKIVKNSVASLFHSITTLDSIFWRN